MLPSPKDHEVIDVASNGPALIEGRGLRSLTLDGADALGHYDDGNGASQASEIGEEPLEDEDDAQATEGEEHAYRRGRQAVPMDSPGDDLHNGHLILDEDEEDADATRGIGVQRLRRLRGRRGFFHSDTDGRSFRYRSSGGILQRITLRRRKREDHDVFWTAIGVLTLLSFALMTCIIIYLTQTDFFESHQNDLFGTTVDNRFTVVAEDDAEIFLKSGYSNSVYSEGTIAFDDGELRIGRRALAAGETQSFYGVSFFSNGTASFTNRVESPMVEADYLTARKGVVFDDGTVMTTAANSSGGVKEQGDLNLVSRSGTVVTSAGGKSLLFVDPDGTVTVANTKADDPTLKGITLDGTRGFLSIGDGLTLKHDENSSSLSTSQALRLDVGTILVGSSSSGKVQISVPDDIGGSGEDKSEDGARALASADRAEQSESVTLEVAGQMSSVKNEGGDVRIVGGDGLQIGGDVTLIGGLASESESKEYGTIAINAGLHQGGSSITEIGSHSATHEVNVHGLVSFNHKSSGVNETTQVKVGGGRFNVSSQRITLDNRATGLSELHINSNDLRLGASTPSVLVGKAGLSAVTVQGASITIDATKSIGIGGSSSSIIVGDSKTASQVTKVTSSAIQLDAAHSVDINTHNPEAITTISGLVHFNGSSTTSSLLSITDTAVRANPPRFRVGAKGKTSIASIEATHVSIGAPGANGTVLPPRGSKLEFFSSSITVGSEASEVSVTGKSVVVDAVGTLVLGGEADVITVGRDDVGQINVKGEAVSITGSTTISGAAISIQSSKVDIGGKSTSDITIGAPGAAVDVGSQAKLISIGADSPTVNIGSESSEINLSGSVTINGKTLDSRRLAGVWTEAKSKRFGYLNADRFAVAVTPTEPRTTFILRWDNAFSSEPQAYQVDARDERMLLVSSAVGSDSGVGGHLQISLQVASVALAIQNEAAAATATPSKIRCRVYRHASKQTAIPDAVAMEVNAVVEHCFGTECADGIFLGLQGQRIVPYSSGDTFSTQCTLTSSATGQLVLQDAQYSFAEQ
ncbi:hypothetical protein KRP22_000849 [Phytophthora ramorum]|nr:hypothetical protein KRP22_414 [Phytophthora ramorum]